MRKKMPGHHAHGHRLELNTGRISFGNWGRGSFVLQRCCVTKPRQWIYMLKFVARHLISKYNL